MAVNYTPLDIPPIDDETPAEQVGDMLNNRFAMVEESVNGLHADVRLVNTWMIGKGRFVGVDRTAGAPVPDTGLSIRLSPSAGNDPVKYLIDGEPFVFTSDFPVVVTGVPANQTQTFGYLSKDPETGEVVVRPEHWFTTLQTDNSDLEGFPFIGRYTTSATSILSYDTDDNDVIVSLAQMQRDIETLQDQMEALTGDGEGSILAAVEQLDFEFAGSGKDTRKTNIVVRDFLAQAKAYTDEQIATGGNKMMDTPTGGLFSHIGTLYRGMADIYPEGVRKGKVLVVRPAFTGTGAGDSLDQDMGGTLPESEPERNYNPQG